MSRMRTDIAATPGGEGVRNAAASPFRPAFGEKVAGRPDEGRVTEATFERGRPFPAALTPIL
ncbi:hypothetical protein CN130_04795 [Sinorhizobium meliloti]|nr:hypothetical protein CN130_04795 [Sinorhizobium meliloti]